VELWQACNLPQHSNQHCYRWQVCQGKCEAVLAVVTYHQGL